MPLKRIFTDKEVSLARERYAQLASTRDIAAMLGCAYNTVNRLLRDSGVRLDKGPRISAKMTGRPSALRGRKWSLESRRRLSVAKTGKPGKTGYRFTPAQRANMSAAQRRIQAADPDRLLRARALRKRLPPKEVAARAAVRRACKNMLNRILRMARVRKDRRLESMLGYSKQQLRAHIEAQFTGAMSWGVRGSFHIDHIVPIAAFFRHGISDPRIVNALVNLRPLLPFDNQSKNGAYDDVRFEADLARIRYALGTQLPLSSMDISRSARLCVSERHQSESRPAVAAAA